MSIISTLFILLGVITLLIGVFAYKKRTLIMEALYVRANAKRALRELEQNMYMGAYEEALKEELPRAMKEKAIRDVQKKYNKTPLTEKFANMATEAQKQATMRKENPNHKSGFETVMDDLNVFSWKTQQTPKKVKSTRKGKKGKRKQSLWDF